MSRIKSITPAENQDVYNMEVEKVHNFAVNGGLIVHNCDALRYFAVFWTRPNEVPEVRVKARWTQDMWDDYNRASSDEREYMIKSWGNPF